MTNKQGLNLHSIFLSLLSPFSSAHGKKTEGHRVRITWYSCRLLTFQALAMFVVSGDGSRAAIDERLKNGIFSTRIMFFFDTLSLDRRMLRYILVYITSSL